MDARIELGQLMTRSVHWYVERAERRPRRKAVGIVTEKKYLDNGNGVEIWPYIHWEGELRPSLCHPANVTPYRQQTKRKLN